MLSKSSQLTVNVCLYFQYFPAVDLDGMMTNVACCLLRLLLSVGEWGKWNNGMGGMRWIAICFNVFLPRNITTTKKDTVSEACWGGGGVAMGMLRRQSTATRLPQAKSPWATPGQPFPLFRKRKKHYNWNTRQKPRASVQTDRKKAKAPSWRKPHVSPVVNWREKEIQLCHVCVTTAWICTLIGRILFFFQC